MPNPSLSNLSSLNVNGSKPSINAKDPNLSPDANINIANINTDGILESSAGTIYISQSIITLVQTTVDSRCCETSDLVTSVSTTKEEIIIPVVYNDDCDNIKEVVRSTNREDNCSGREWRYEPAIDGVNPT
tara:strand:- start:342 stop:734 length:393 start_codon:yes stop_codon:yes gene_type:complete